MIHLIAIFAVGFSAAGLVLLAFRLRGRKPPRYVIPLAAGLTMIGYALWSDYAWAPHTIAGLPAHITVVKKIPSQAPWKPWTYLFPQVDRFIALDGSQTRKNDDLPGFVLAELILVARLEPAVVTQQLFDCARARRTDIIPSEGFAEDGMPKAPQWVPIDRSEALFQLVCEPA